MLVQQTPPVYLRPVINDRAQILPERESFIIVSTPVAANNTPHTHWITRMLCSPATQYQMLSLVFQLASCLSAYPLLTLHPTANVSEILQIIFHPRIAI